MITNAAKNVDTLAITLNVHIIILV